MTYVPALDGLRGISLPGTIYTHFQIFLSALPTAPAWIMHSRFYLRRSRRLGPALIAVVPLLLIAQYALPGSSSQPLGTTPWLTAVLILAFAGNWADRRGRRSRLVLVACAIVIVVVTAISTLLDATYQPTHVVYMTPTQISPILIGCVLGYTITANPGGWLAALLRSRIVALAGLGGMVLISIEWDANLTALAEGGYALYGVAASLVIGHCMVRADQPTVWNNVLGWKPFVIIGQVSYEGYLVHCIVIIDVLLIAAISGIFYYLVERPIRRHGWRNAFRRSATAPGW